MNKKPFLLILATTALVGSPVLIAGSAFDSVAKVAPIVGLDKEPVAIRKVRPAYPEELGGLGIHGMATVEMVVGTNGRVSSVKLIDSTEPEFGQLALIAAKHWTFTPGTVKGVAVTKHVRVPFEFLPDLSL